MITAAGVSQDDTVIEIGPGFGILTLALAERARRVIAFEIERKLEDYWEEIKDKRYEIRDKEINGDKIEIVWGNALKELKVHKVPRERDPVFAAGHKVYKVIANLPYQITSNVLRTLLELENKPESITIMVQKEVAERICAKPGEMSLLSVSVQYYGEPKIVCTVGKGNFWPEPKVDSAILHIKTKKQKNKKAFDDLFFRVVKAGFANKRKQAWKNISTQLKVESYKVKSVISEVAGNEKARAEELSVEEWQTISRFLLEFIPVKTEGKGSDN